MFLRKFIILNKKSDQNAKGHAKLEVRNGRGKISLNLEGLDTKLDEEEIYKGYLLANEKNDFRQVDIGTIVLTKDGRGALDWEFNSSSVGGTDIDIENFNIVLIKLDTNHSNELEIPLAGYIHTDDRTIQIVMNKLEKQIKKSTVKKAKIEEIEEIEKIENKEVEEISEIKKIEKVEEIEEIEEIEEVVDIEDLLEIEEEPAEIEDKEELDKIEDIENIEETENIENIQQIEEIQELEDDLEKVEDETPEINKEEDYKAKIPMYKKDEDGFIEKLQEYLIDNDIINTEDIEDTKKTSPDQSRSSSTFRGNQEYRYDETYTDNSYMQEGFYSRQIANYTLNVLEFFKKVDPFKEQIEGYTWWEIEYDKRNINSGFLPYYNYLINMYYPYNCITQHATSQSQIKKYDHYIFGVLKEEEKISHYVYGIPGKYIDEEQPYGGKTGFVTWFEKAKQDEGLGYWIIYIDALTGNIVRPL